MNKRSAIHTISAVSMFLIIATATLVYLSDDWRTWRSANCWPDNCFCEAIQPGAVAQPANTWSSLSFVCVGIAILLSAIGERSSSLRDAANRENKIFAAGAGAVYSFSVLLIGLGSAFYHASLSFVGQFFDLLGMYLLITFVILHNLARIRKLPAPGFAGWFVISNLVLAYFLVDFSELRRYIFGGLVIAALSLEFLARPKKKPAPQSPYLQLAMTSFGLGFLVWILDITKILCEPTSWLQGHALWHVLGAIAAGLLFLHFRSETYQIS